MLHPKENWYEWVKNNKSSNLFMVGCRGKVVYCLPDCKAMKLWFSLSCSRQVCVSCWLWKTKSLLKPLQVRAKKVCANWSKIYQYSPDRCGIELTWFFHKIANKLSVHPALQDIISLQKISVSFFSILHSACSYVTYTHHIETEKWSVFRCTKQYLFYEQRTTTW